MAKIALTESLVFHSHSAAAAHDDEDLFNVLPRKVAQRRVRREEHVVEVAKVRLKQLQRSALSGVPLNHIVVGIAGCVATLKSRGPQTCRK